MTDESNTTEKPRYLTRTEQQIMDKALRRSVHVAPHQPQTTDESSEEARRLLAQICGIHPSSAAERLTKHMADVVFRQRARAAQIVRAKKPPRGVLSWWICDELEMIAQEIEHG